MILISNVKTLGLVVSDKIFVKNATPRGGSIFGPRGTYLNKLGRSLLDNATYQIPNPI